MQIQLLKKSQAAGYAGVTRQTIDNWIAAGKVNVYFSASKSDRATNKVGWLNPKELDAFTKKK